MRNTDWRQAAMLGGIGVAVVLLWDTPVVYPLKLLVVFFHEMSHGLAAIVTGGQIVEIQVVPQEGGHCITAGGNRFLTLTAGYLGSLVWGGLLLVAAARTHADKVVSAALGLLLVLVSVMWVRPVVSFGMGFGAATGIALAGIGAFAPRGINDILLKIIGLTSCLYAVLDIKSDVLDRPGIPSDAYMLAELTGVPTVIWGGLWILIAAGAALYFVYLACRRDGTVVAAGTKTDM